MRDLSKESPHNIMNRTTSRTDPLVGESILYDIFMKYGTPTDQKMAKLEKMFESRLRTLAKERRNNFHNTNQDLLIECACDLLTEMVLSFNTLLVGIIEPEEQLKFFFSQTTYIDRHLLEIPSMIEKKLRAITSPRVNENKLAKALIKLIRKAHATEIVEIRKS